MDDYRAWTKADRAPYIERDGRFWQVVFPARSDEGMDTCTGPHLTKWGARLSLWFSTWIEGGKGGT